jgi:hypothetical protein
MIKSRIMKWAGRVALIGELRNVYKILIGKPEEKIVFGRSWRFSEEGLCLVNSFRPNKVKVFPVLK